MQANPKLLPSPAAAFLLAQMERGPSIGTQDSKRMSKRQKLLEHSDIASAAPTDRQGGKAPCKPGASAGPSEAADWSSAATSGSGLHGSAPKTRSHQ